MQKSTGSANKFNEYKYRVFNYKFSLILLLIVYPYLVGFSPDSTSSSNTIVDLLIGFGNHSHVSYDCAGNAIQAVNYSSIDYGISATHNIDIFEFGGRAGGYSANVSGYIDYSGVGYYDYQFPEDDTPVYYLNPFIGIETEYFGLNVGASLFSQEANSSYIYSSVGTMSGNLAKYLLWEGKIHPTWLVRMGSKDGFYFSTQYLSSVPIFSGGGIADAGLGFGSTESRNLTWIGTSFGPYQNLGLSVRQDIQLSDKFDLLLRGRAGIIEDNFEGGLSAGIRIGL